MKKTIVIHDSNFYNRLVDLKIIPVHPDREAPVSLLRKVKELDLSDAHIHSAKELVYFVRLRTLNLLYNNIEELDLSQNIELRTVMVSGKKLRRLYLANLMKLHYLFVNGPIDNLELPEGNSLFELSVTGTKLFELNIRPCRQLRVLDASHNRLTHLDLSSQSLIYLNVKSNRLKKLDLSGQSQLEYVNAIENRLQECVCPSKKALRYLLLEGNPIDTKTLQRDSSCSAVQFSDPYPMRRDTYQSYVNNALLDLRDAEMRCIADGSSPHFCSDIMRGELYDFLRKYDAKRLLYRYKEGMVVLSYRVVFFLDLLNQQESYPVLREEDFDYIDLKQTYFQEASALGLFDFPEEIELIIQGRSVTFEGDEVAFTSSYGVPNEFGYVRYIERITGKIRAQRALVIWND